MGGSVGEASVTRDYWKANSDNLSTCRRYLKYLQVGSYSMTAQPLTVDFQGVPGAESPSGPDGLLNF